MREMTMFEPSRTKVAAIPIPMPFLAIVVTASVGHVPKTSLNTGFSLKKPFVNVSNAFAFILAISISPLYNFNSVKRCLNAFCDRA
jgi:hypothetical protein